MSFIVYDKKKLNKIAVVNTIEEAEKIKTKKHDIIETDKTDKKLIKNGNKIEFVDYEVVNNINPLPSYILDIQERLEKLEKKEKGIIAEGEVK